MNVAPKTLISRLTLAGILLVLSTFAWAAPAQHARFKSKQGYTIMPPMGLPRLQSPSSNVDVMFADGKGISLNIIVHPVPAGTSLEKTRRLARTMIGTGLPHFKVLSEGSMKLDGTKALTFTSLYVVGEPPIPFRTLSIIAFHGGKSYVLSCGGRVSRCARYDAALKKSLASLRWTK